MKKQILLGLIVLGAFESNFLCAMNYSQRTGPQQGTATNPAAEKAMPPSAANIKDMTPEQLKTITIEQIQNMDASQITELGQKGTLLNATQRRAWRIRLTEVSRGRHKGKLPPSGSDAAPGQVDRQESITLASSKLDEASAMMNEMRATIAGLKAEEAPTQSTTAVLQKDEAQLTVDIATVATDQDDLAAAEAGQTEPGAASNIRPTEEEIIERLNMLTPEELERIITPEMIRLGLTENEVRALERRDGLTEAQKAAVKIVLNRSTRAEIRDARRAGTKLLQEKILKNLQDLSSRDGSPTGVATNPRTPEEQEEHDAVLAAKLWAQEKEFEEAAAAFQADSASVNASEHAAQLSALEATRTALFQEQSELERIENTNDNATEIQESQNAFDRAAALVQGKGWRWVRHYSSMYLFRLNKEIEKARATGVEAMRTFIENQVDSGKDLAMNAVGDMLKAAARKRVSVTNIRSLIESAITHNNDTVDGVHTRGLELLKELKGNVLMDRMFTPPDDDITKVITNIVHKQIVELKKLELADHQAQTDRHATGNEATEAAEETARLTKAVETAAVELSNARNVAELEKLRLAHLKKEAGEGITNDAIAQSQTEVTQAEGDVMEAEQAHQKAEEALKKHEEAVREADQGDHGSEGNGDMLDGI